jgi:hypothetical protein
MEIVSNPQVYFDKSQHLPMAAVKHVAYGPKGIYMVTVRTHLFILFIFAEQLLLIIITTIIVLLLYLLIRYYLLIILMIYIITTH